MLKPLQPQPLKEHEKVTISVHSERSPLLEAYGIMGSKCTAEELERFALDDEFDPFEN